MRNTTVVKSVCALAVVTVLATGCTKSMAGNVSGSSASAVATATTPAATLRTALNALLSEHVILAAAATSAALDGRDAEFKAAAGALDANSVDLARAIGSVYGADAEQAFLPLWRRHIGFAVDYTVGVATKDAAKQQKAVADLLAYTQDFGAFLASANPNLPKSVVAELVKHHVVTLKAVIDAQATRDYARAYAAERAASAHMQMIADPLAQAIVKQFPDRFVGNPQTPAAGLRTSLNVTLREHASSPPPRPTPRSEVATRSSKPPPPHSMETRWTSRRRSAPSTARTPSRRFCLSGAATSDSSSTTPWASRRRTRARRTKR
jgi:hypothetical protein